MRTHNSRIIPVFLCLLCLLALLPAPVRAAGPIDPTQEVCLTIHYQHDGRPVSGVPFDLFYVASVDAYGEFTLTGDFAGYPVRLTGLDSDGWRMLAETLAAYAAADRLTPLDSGVTNAQGLLTFPNRRSSMKPGLYLAVGQQYSDGAYVYTTEPFLAALPVTDEASNTWVYDLTVSPKHTADEVTPPSDDTTERKVLKVWDDGGDMSSRPQEVTVQLLKNGAVYDTVTLSARNNWRHTWDKLPKNDASGRRIEWSVVERDVSGYTVLVSREGLTFVITNSRTPGKPAEPSTPGKPSLPQTGLLWWPVPLLALCGLAFVIAGVSFGKRKHHDENQ